MGRMQINTEAVAILSQISGNGGFDKGFDNDLFIWCQSKKGILLESWKYSILCGENNMGIMYLVDSSGLDQDVMKT